MSQRGHGSITILPALARPRSIPSASSARASGSRSPTTGRIRPAAADPAGIGAEWWVLWVDADYRTLVVGTPSGSFGMILNRTSDLPPDRLAAAREVLAWNGYDLGRMRAVGPR